jgi:hypothetical protein
MAFFAKQCREDNEKYEICKERCLPNVAIQGHYPCVCDLTRVVK